MGWVQNPPYIIKLCDCFPLLSVTWPQYYMQYSWYYTLGIIIIILFVSTCEPL